MVLNLFKLFKPVSFGYKSFIAPSSVRSETKDNILREWKNINILIQGKQPSQLRQAVISADKTLDSALKDMYTGETMAERLKNSKGMFELTLYNRIWEAHRVRNSLVHESGYEPPYYMLLNCVDTYKESLEVLGLRLK